MKRLQLPLYIASLWLALATALLSSLMPGGLPRSTALGSAFNPATTAVALQPSRAQPRAAIESVRRDDEPPSGQGNTVAVAPLPAAPAAPAYGLPLSPEPLTAAPALPSFPVLDGSPRGPPLP
ncbi:MAG TPA: hypothetical protein VLG14_01980 [Sphingomonas sp.]|nr:hypothetical protein [Sphingomonas sp.]